MEDYNAKYNTLEAATRYTRRGYSVVPVKRGKKNPMLPGWPSLRVDEDQVPDYFKHGDNVGLLLGQASGGLVDVDLDSDEAEILGPHFLTTDTMVSGRGGRKRHYFYVSPGMKSKTYEDTDGSVLLETRSDGAQTVIEGVHPSEDRYELLDDREPVSIDVANLRERCAKLATATLLLKHLPDKGRHDISNAFAGTLLRKLIGSLDEDEAADLVEGIMLPVWNAIDADKGDIDNVQRNIRSTANRIMLDEKTTGAKRLEELLGEQIVPKLDSYWGWIIDPTPEQREQNERRQRAKRAEKAWEDNRVQDLAHSPDILERVYRELVADGLMSEEANAKLLTLGAVSLLRGEPISAIIKGTSSVGKSEIIKAVTRALPEEMVIERQSMSERALAYMGKDGLKNKILVVYELGGLGTEGKESLEMAKQLLSEGKLSRQIAESSNNGVSGKLVEVDGPTALWTTTTRTKTDYELSNRVFELTPDDSREQTGRINEDIWDDEEREPEDFAPTKGLLTWIMGQDNRVSIPFGKALGKLMPSSAVKMRRESKRVKNLICAHAVLHQATRERTEDGRIIAALDDYEQVRGLVEHMVGESAEKSVSPTVRETVQTVLDMLEDSEKKGVTTAELAEKIDRDNSATSKRIKAAAPYLVELDEKRDRKKQYGKGTNLPEEGPVLPAKDEVRAFWQANFGGGGGTEKAEESACQNSDIFRARTPDTVSRIAEEPVGKGFLGHGDSDSDPSENGVPKCQNSERAEIGVPYLPVLAQEKARRTPTREEMVDRLFHIEGAHKQIKAHLGDGPLQGPSWCAENVPLLRGTTDELIARALCRVMRERSRDTTHRLTPYKIKMIPANEPEEGPSFIPEGFADEAEYDAHLKRVAAEKTAELERTWAA